MKTIKQKFLLLLVAISSLLSAEYSYAQLNCTPLPQSATVYTTTTKSITPKTSRSNSCRIFDLSGLAADDAHGLSNSVSKASITDLVIISDANLANKPLMAQLKGTKSPLILNVGDNSVRSRSVAQTMLSKKFNKVSTLAVLPQDRASINKVWNRSVASPAAITQMRRAHTQFAALPNSTIISGPGEISFKAQVLHSIESGPSGDLFVLVGHNENGLVRGPDGTFISVKEFSQALGRSKRSGLVLSCETMLSGQIGSPALVTTDKLLPEQVAQALMATQTRLSSYAAPTYNDFFVEFANSVHYGVPLEKRDIKILLKITAAGVITATVVTVSGDNRVAKK